MTAYLPVCDYCRADSHTHYRTSCSGCTARRARISAEHNQVSDAQVDAADSLFGVLPETHDD